MILEIGCGQTPYPNATVTIDKSRDSKCTVLADAMFLPFKNGTFRHVVSFQTLEHITNPHQTLKEIRRVLKNYGKVFITIPNLLHWRALLRWIVKRQIYTSKGHLYGWRLVEITNLLVHSGFKIENVIYGNSHYHTQHSTDNFLPHITTHSVLVTAQKNEEV